MSTPSRKPVLQVSFRRYNGKLGESDIEATSVYLRNGMFEFYDEAGQMVFLVPPHHLVRITLAGVQVE